MSIVICKTCHSVWDAGLQSECFTCLFNKWLQTPDFLRPKHDPRNLSTPYSSFRSVMSFEFLRGSVPILQHVATHGTAFCSGKPRHAGKLCFIGPSPDGMVAGSAVPHNGIVTGDAFEYIVVADLLGNPHVHAESGETIEFQIADGSLVELSYCSELGCNNFVMPGEQKCALHVQPPLADNA